MALGQKNTRRNVLCIGPAGENLSRIAAIMNDGARALARGGPGAVMGSKNLKAVVVEGDARPEIADREQFKFVQYESRKMLTASPLTSQALPEFGTVVLMNVVNYVGALPTRNFRQSQFEGADRVSGEALRDSYLVKNAACWACPIACTRISKTDEVEGEGPEYETAWAFGAQCGVDDLATIVEVEMASGTPQMAQVLAETLKGYKIVMLRGHGSFATGQTLDEAFQWTSALEECSQIILAARLIDEPFIEYRKMSASYREW